MEPLVAAWRRHARACRASVFGSVAASVLVAAGTIGVAAGAPPAGTTPSAPAASAPPTHRPLRSNVPVVQGDATEPEVFSGVPGAPPHTVQERRSHLALYPCSQCHKVLPLNTTPRKLVAAPHVNALKHGGGRLWCLDCHLGSDRDWLHALDNTKVDFDDPSRLCGQCHGARQRDWAWGGHGKRVAGWGPGQRQLYACTHCHDPHNPVLQPRAPAPVPPVRAGLQAMKREPEPHTMPWQRAASAAAGKNDHVASIRP